MGTTKISKLIFITYKLFNKINDLLLLKQSSYSNNWIIINISRRKRKDKLISGFQETMVEDLK